MSEPQLPQSLLQVLASLTEWFKDQHVPYAIIGGAAIGFLAQPRATQDIDAVTWLDLGEAAGFVKSGARFGFFPRISNPIDFVVKSRVLLIITKAVAHRKRDLLDIDNIVSVYPNLDLARIRHWVGQFAAVLEAPELVKDLENVLENRH